ncbi:pyridoxal-phosphate dependent TrpB-like enzyme [Geobacter metallireducens RCH3]|uniref:Tryptophan synthase beta chain n=1 Tax=Geobacter metallireducens (strain ATCC 53774 / DSM 7210 / GS-15) TaxID=269799 RepID=Q39SQ8_GEOMG|nr:TrpB-like pyridoxal phosphate-dependent enzyme [Geobacter metallireducens]ABB32716.1 tryptophan synthase, homodimeric beta subunit [Geobacter metallireducens GS-15]EHP84096.1 pyridoxal-phosphate dependent TrpB-like enzyme [Geobacter metallireducens RCH3]
MQTKILLDESRIPTHWYNIIPDMPGPLAPVINPRTLQPVTPDDLLPIFPMAIIEQEVSGERWIPIPEEVREIYRLWRPSPLYRARRLEQALGTPAKIYYKYEGVSPAGSHKPNSAIPQAFYNKQAGIRRLATETGAGQWGSSLALACSMFGLECTVYMVKVSCTQKPYRKSMMQLWGANVIPSPSEFTNAGRAILAHDPDSNGSLGIAISEAVEDAVSRPDTNYALGSVLNHVCLHQTVIGQEAKEQLALAGDYPDVVIACCGGGSNFAGTAFPFLADRAAGKNVRCLAVEPASCPTLTKGVYAFDYGDTAKMAPIAMMYTLGHDFMPPGIHAGGLRYHGESALVSQLHHAGLIEAKSYRQNACFEAAHLFARSEGIVPAPESSHAVRAAIDEAVLAKEEGKEKTILFCLSGHGQLDMGAYDAYLSGGLEDFEYPEEMIRESLARLPKVDL